MRVIILSFILLLCSCCPIDSNNDSIQKNSIQKNDEIVVNCSNKYKITGHHGTVTTLYEFELHGHIFLVNAWNDYKLIHALWCPCKHTQSTTTTESIFESNSFF